MRLKFCRKCSTHKPADYFWKQSYRPDGLQAWCIACINSAREIAAQRNRNSGIVAPEKHCMKCASTKSNRYFHRNSHRKDGLAVWCKECQQLYHKAHYRKNKNSIVHRTKQRAAKKRAVETRGQYTFEDWEQIKVDFWGSCAYCGVRSDALEQDHVIPLSKGGHVGYSNIVPACKACNNSKADKTLLGWLFTNRRSEACV